MSKRYFIEIYPESDDVDDIMDAYCHSTYTCTHCPISSLCRDGTQKEKLLALLMDGHLKIEDGEHTWN